MKRLLSLGIGVFLSIFIMNIPVWAAVDIKGQIFFDTYYYHQDSQGFGRNFYTSLKTQQGSGGVAGVPVGTASKAEDRNQTYFELNHATALRFHWTNEQGLGAFTAIYMNAEPTQSLGTDAGFKVGVSTAFLYYDIIKDLRLTVGRGGFTQVFSPFDPTTHMGYDGVCKVEGLGFGNINSKYQNSIRLTYKLPMIASIDLALLDPRMTSDTELMGGPGFVAKSGTAIDNNSRIPKIEVGVPLVFGGKWGRVAVTPSAMYLKQQFNNIASGDDSITSYGLSLGGLVSVMGLKLMAEYNYGQNLWNAGKAGQATSYAFKYEYITGGMRGAMGARALNGTVYDSKSNGLWVQLGYNILGRVEPTVFYGRLDTKRDMPTAPSPAPLSGIDAYGDSSFTTQMYGINIPIKITSNFSVTPEFMMYDSGSSNKINGTTYDFGKEWLAGVQWKVFF
jgi:hypothetical protein